MEDNAWGTGFSIFLIQPMIPPGIARYSFLDTALDNDDIFWDLGYSLVYNDTVLETFLNTVLDTFLDTVLGTALDTVWNTV